MHNNRVSRRCTGSRTLTPTSWEDPSLIAYYCELLGRDVCSYSCTLGAVVVHWLWTFMTGKKHTPQSVARVTSFSENTQSRYLIIMALLTQTSSCNKQPVFTCQSCVTAVKERDLSREQDWVDFLSESWHDLLAISFDFHIQSKPTKTLHLREGWLCLCPFIWVGTGFRERI